MLGLVQLLSITIDYRRLELNPHEAIPPPFHAVHKRLENRGRNYLSLVSLLPSSSGQE